MKPRSASHHSSRARSAHSSGKRRAKTLQVSRARAPKSTGRKKSRGSKKTAQISANAEITIDREEIQHWAEDRGGIPAVVKKTHRREDEGILRIDFPGYSGERTLEHISWDEWFDIFEERELAFLCQKRKANGEASTFNKLVSRSELF